MITEICPSGAGVPPNSPMRPGWAVYGERVVRSGGLTPHEGIWGPFVLMAPIALFFLVQARNDADLFDLGVYKTFLKKLFR